MSSKSEKKKYKELPYYGILEEDPLNLKLAIISFTNFGKSEKFIYDGHEKIPFKERHVLYQCILKNEFTILIRRNSKRKFSTHLTF